VGVSLLFDSGDLIKQIKRIAMDAVAASKPADMVIGTVVSVNPLKIQIDQKLILTSAQLVLLRNVTDYRLSVTVDHITEIGGDGHSHSVTGKKEFLIHNALQANETVVMMQMSGGQKYIVIDRVEKGDDE
jgi:hypothetical protein